MSNPAAMEILRLHTASEANRVSVAGLLAEAKLAPLDAAAQFGPQYVVAFGVDGGLAGVAGLEVYGRDALLRSVAVAPRLRSKGLGRRLTQDRLTWAANRGIQRIFLLTTDARSYWERYGFVVIGRGDAPPGIQGSTQWAGGCSATAIAMQKTL
jgi:amino-acid N-acetyltransferase